MLLLPLPSFIHTHSLLQVLTGQAATDDGGGGGDGGSNSGGGGLLGDIATVPDTYHHPHQHHHHTTTSATTGHMQVVAGPDQDHGHYTHVAHLPDTQVGAFINHLFLCLLI